MSDLSPANRSHPLWVATVTFQISTGCPKKHVRRLNGYCEGAINQIFLFYQFMNRRDFHLKFGTEFD